MPCCCCPPLPPLLELDEVDLERDEEPLLFALELPPLLRPPEVPEAVVRLAAVAFPPLAPAFAFWAFEPAEPAFDCDDLADPEVLDAVDERPPEALLPPDLPPPDVVRFAPPEPDVRDDAVARPPLAPAFAFCVLDPPLEVLELLPEVLELPDVREALLLVVLLAAVALPPFAPAFAFCVFDPADPAFDCDDLARDELPPLDVLARDELAPPLEDLARDDPPLALFAPPVLLDPPELLAVARPPADPKVFAAAVFDLLDDDDDEERDPVDFDPPVFDPPVFDPDDLLPVDLPPEDFDVDDFEPDDEFFLVVAIMNLPPKKVWCNR